METAPANGPGPEIPCGPGVGACIIFAMSVTLQSFAPGLRRPTAVPTQDGYVQKQYTLGQLAAATAVVVGIAARSLVSPGSLRSTTIEVMRPWTQNTI